MQAAILFVLAAILACNYAEVYVPEGYDYEYPKFYKHSVLVRHPRDLSWGLGNFGGGQLFGSLNPDQLSGSAGYSHDLFDDSRGRLQGTAYGTRSLLEDSTKYGGKLNWNNANENLRAGLDVHKTIDGRSGLEATADGVWRLDNHSKLSGGAYVKKDFDGRGAEGGLRLTGTF